MKNKIEEEEVKKDPILNVHQICNELKISGIHREYVEKRFNEKEFTLEEWKENFKKVRLEY